MDLGDRVKWQLQSDVGDVNHASGWGVVVGTSPQLPSETTQHVLVEVHSFPAWLKELDGQFHPVIRCATTWLTKF